MVRVTPAWWAAMFFLLTEIVLPVVVMLWLVVAIPRTLYWMTDHGEAWLRARARDLRSVSIATLRFLRDAAVMIPFWVRKALPKKSPTSPPQGPYR